MFATYSLDLHTNNFQKLNASANSSSFGNCSFIPGIKPLESPGVTPIKPLPFSPSQFLNSPSMNLSFDIKIPASTPVRKYSNAKVFTFFSYFLSFQFLLF